MDSDAARDIDWRQLVKWGGVAAASAVAAGVPPVSAGIGHAYSASTNLSGPHRIPPDTKPGAGKRA